MRQTLSKLVIGKTFLEAIKAIYGKPAVSNTLNEEKLEAFPVRFVIRQGCPVSSLVFNIGLEVLARVSS